MIDAATIGITLALNNGVSDGIALIRRELAGLDAAVAASAVGLTRLSALAESSGLAGATRAAAALLPVLPRPSAAATAGASEVDPTAAPTQPHAAPIDPALGAPRVMAVEPSVVMPDTARAPIPARSDASSSPALSPAMAEAPNFAVFGRALAAAPVQPARHPNVDVERASRPRWELSRAMPMAPIGPVAVSLPEKNDEPTTVMRAPVAPMLRPFTATSLPLQVQTPLVRQTDASGETERHELGEIHLDGHMIGRFISEHLADAATRPPAGATGFDPRLSPAWSGSAGAA